MTGCTVNRYEQFETSPETIEQVKTCTAIYPTTWPLIRKLYCVTCVSTQHHYFLFLECCERIVSHPKGLAYIKPDTIDSCVYMILWLCV